MTNYYKAKIISINDIYQTRITVKQARDTLNSLWRFALRHSGCPQFIEQETLALILLERPDSWRLEEILSKPPRRIDQCDFPYIDKIDTALEILQGMKDEKEISIQEVLESYFGGAEEIVKSLPQMVPHGVKHDIEGNPLIMGMPLGTETPPDKSRSDPLTEEEAYNLWQFHYAIAHSIAEGINRIHGEMSPIGGIEPYEVAGQRLFGRAEGRLLRLVGHIFREKLPWLGHNCWPLQGASEYVDEILPLYAELVRRNMSQFFRYKDLYLQVFQGNFFKLLKERAAQSDGNPSKIRILYMGGRTLEEPLSLALLAKLSFDELNLRGALSDWLEIVAVNWLDLSSEDIKHYCQEGKYDAEFWFDVPTEIRGRAENLIIREGEGFRFCGEVSSVVKQHFLPLLNPEIKDHAVFTEQAWDIIFNLKTLEYLAERCRSTKEAETAKWLVEFPDSGSGLKDRGLYCTDGRRPGGAGLRTLFSSMSLDGAMRGMFNAVLRRMPGLGDNMASIIGPAKAMNMDFDSLLKAEEMMAPIQMPELSERLVWRPLYEPREAEVAAYRLERDRVQKMKQKRLKDVRKAIKKAETIQTRSALDVNTWRELKSSLEELEKEKARLEKELGNQATRSRANPAKRKTKNKKRRR